MEMKRMIVHNGKFHADDVMACALVRRVFPEVVIERVSEVTEEMRQDPAAIIADIGRGKFDHHQEDAVRRPCPLDNKYVKTAVPVEFKAAACGLIFDEYRDRIFKTSYAANRFFRNYIRPIEIQDNVGKGRTQNPLSMAVIAFNVITQDEEKQMQAFMRAEHILEEIIDAEVTAEARELELEKTVRKHAESAEDGILILPTYMPWRKAVKGLGIRYVVMPSRNEYVLQTAGRSLPKSWLEKKPAGCTFVHQGRFLSAFESEEAAIRAAKECMAPAHMR